MYVANPLLHAYNYYIRARFLNGIKSISKRSAAVRLQFDRNEIIFTTVVVDAAVFRFTYVIRIVRAHRWQHGIRSEIQ